MNGQLSARLVKLEERLAPVSTVYSVQRCTVCNESEEAALRRAGHDPAEIRERDLVIFRDILSLCVCGRGGDHAAA